MVTGFTADTHHQAWEEGAAPSLGLMWAERQQGVSERKWSIAGKKEHGCLVLTQSFMLLEWKLSRPLSRVTSYARQWQINSEMELSDLHLYCLLDSWVPSAPVFAISSLEHTQAISLKPLLHKRDVPLMKCSPAKGDHKRSSTLYITWIKSYICSKRNDMDVFKVPNLFESLINDIAYLFSD